VVSSPGAGDPNAADPIECPSGRPDDGDRAWAGAAAFAFVASSGTSNERLLGSFGSSFLG
jgi:hypothetical protein